MTDPVGIGAATEPPRKYRNRPTTVDGIRFASKAEARRYAELKLLEKAGQITDLELQPSFNLHAINALHQPVFVGKYVADFAYQEVQETPNLLSFTPVVEDVKSPATEKNALFRWKRRHFEAEYGITLRVIK